MKHPGTHRVVATHGFGRNTGSRHKFQALVLEGCQGEMISLLTVRKGRMVCNLCCCVLFCSFFFQRTVDEAVRQTYLYSARL